MEIRKPARTRNLCWRELNYGAISTTSLFLKWNDRGELGDVYWFRILSPDRGG
jgi:hypothetical protein